MNRTHDSQCGFTLIEVIVFIVVTGLVMSTLLLSANTALRNSPSVSQQWIALQTAKRCMEWFLVQRRVNGYSSLTCPSTPSPSACSAPSGFTVTNSITCQTWNSDAAYKTVTVSVSGLANASISMQLGDY